jgi:hypothetical protein
LNELKHQEYARMERERERERLLFLSYDENYARCVILKSGKRVKI